jgi:hypothetical protein
MRKIPAVKYRATKIVGLTALAVLGLATTRGQAMAGTITIDQQNTVGTSPSSYVAEVGQTFTPTLSSIDSAIFTLESANGSTSSVVVEVREGVGFSGSLLGTSNPVTVAARTFQSFEFDFPTSIALTPGDVYTLMISVMSGAAVSAEFSASNPYAGGEGVDNGGRGASTVDLVFSEGAVDAPEPASIALALTGLAGLGLVRRRRPMRSA